MRTHRRQRLLRCSAAAAFRGRTCTPHMTSSAFCTGALVYLGCDCVVAAMDAATTDYLPHNSSQIFPQQLKARRRRAHYRTGIRPPHPAVYQQQLARAAAAQCHVSRHAVPAFGPAARTHRHLMMQWRAIACLIEIRKSSSFSCALNYMLPLFVLLFFHRHHPLLS